MVHRKIDTSQPRKTGRSQRLKAGKEYPLYIDTNPRPVAGLILRKDGEIELHKTIKASRHLVSLPRGIAFDSKLYAHAEELGATVIKVRDSETDTTYTTTAANFRRCSFEQNRGYGRQRFMRLEFWSVDGAQPEAERVMAQQAAQRGENQLSLGLAVEERRPLYV